jgi:hypothetical protein
MDSNLIRIIQPTREQSERGARLIRQGGING